MKCIIISIIVSIIIITIIIIITVTTTTIIVFTITITIIVIIVTVIVIIISYTVFYILTAQQQGKLQWLAALGAALLGLCDQQMGVWIHLPTVDFQVQLP